MTRTELLEAIVKKQDELIKYYLHEVADSEIEAVKRCLILEDKIVCLRQQLEECEGKEKILIDFANKLTKDFNEDKSDQSQIGFSTDLDVNDLY